MGTIQSAMPELSPNLKKAVRWISDTVTGHPEKPRDTVLAEAQLRFDLSPRECEFLDQNFTELTSIDDH